MNQDQIVHPQLFDDNRGLGAFYPLEIAIEENFGTRDAAGQKLDAWYTLDGHGTIRASIVAIETVRAGDNPEEDRTVVVELYKCDLAGVYPLITTEHRVKWGERIFTIKRAPLCTYQTVLTLEEVST